MKKWILWGATAVVVALIALYFFQPSRTPSPQPPMDSLSPQNFSDFVNAFNRDTTEGKLVLLLSPT